MQRVILIPNVDLVWPEGASAEQTRVQHLGAADAPTDPGWQLRVFQRKEPHPFFCSIISGCGAHEKESCGVSDKCAEEIVRQTGQPHVYRCRFGLIDIAVPVRVNGQHIATLFTGQVLTSPPTAEGFAQIVKDVAGLDWVNLKELEEAYWNVPVVSEEDIQHTTEMLQTLAEFLVKTWTRMNETIRERRRKDREVQLSRREFAYLALEWSDSERARVGTEEIAQIQRRIGFTQSPNRVLVIRPEESADQKFSFTGSLASALQAVEELCEKLDNVAATRFSMNSICVFLHDASTAPEFAARRLATRILHTIRESCDLGVRIGVGNAREDWRGLAESYREACLALSSSDKPIAVYQKPSASTEELTRGADNICQLLSDKRLEQARAAIAALPSLVSRHLGSELEDLAFARLYFTSVIESMSLAAGKLGCEGNAFASLCDQAGAEFKRTATLFQMHAVWLRFAGEIVDEVSRLFLGKRQKIVERACRMIQSGLERGAGPQALSISALAGQLGISVSHMSRTFKRQTGQTFEQYVIARRVEYAQRLLLDPLNNVSEVALRAGFSDPSYFARVFRKLVGCSPREYCANPQPATR